MRPIYDPYPPVSYHEHVVLAMQTTIAYTRNFVNRSNVRAALAEMQGQGAAHMHSALMQCFHELHS